MTIVDDLGQEWDYMTDVEVMGFEDRTRVPIRVEVSGDTRNETDKNPNTTRDTAGSQGDNQ